MLPEISRRCNSCGASIRETAMFCPECGKALSRSSEVSESQIVTDKPRPPAADANENEASSSQVATGSAADEPAVKAKSTPVVSSTDSSTKPQSSAPSPLPKTGTIEKARDSLHRASTATREALVDNVKRVEKIRQVSSTMIEEAAYDPSLRFVLVALALFVVFIILLVLSKVMG